MTLTPEEIEMIEREAVELYHMPDEKLKNLSGYKMAVRETMTERTCYSIAATKYLTQLKSERERAGKLLGDGDPFPLNDVLRILINATWILLHKKDYDGPDYEEMEIALKRAKETQTAITEYENK